jgi:hypothetical protein
LSLTHPVTQCIENRIALELDTERYAFRNAVHPEPRPARIRRMALRLP